MQKNNPHICALYLPTGFIASKTFKQCKYYTFYPPGTAVNAPQPLPVPRGDARPVRLGRGQEELLRQREGKAGGRGGRHEKEGQEDQGGGGRH